MIYHKFSHGAASYTVNGKNVNVMLEFEISADMEIKIGNVSKYIYIREYFEIPVFEIPRVDCV